MTRDFLLFVVCVGNLQVCPPPPKSPCPALAVCFQSLPVNEALCVLDWRSLDHLLHSFFFYYPQSAATFTLPPPHPLSAYGALTRC